MCEEMRERRKISKKERKGVDRQGEKGRGVYLLG
jgi:hypothetical protein